MILQSLVDYYHRKASQAEGGMAPEGFEKKQIPFVIILDQQGNFVDLEDTRQDEGIAKAGRSFLVPQAIKRTIKVQPNLLWDNINYVLGIVTEEQKKKEKDPKKVQEAEQRAKRQHEEFIKNILNLFPSPQDDKGINAVYTFLSNSDFEKVFNHPNWTDLQKLNSNISFRLNDDTQLVCGGLMTREKIVERLSKSTSTKQICMVSGQPDEIERLHPAIKGVWGAQSSGANIISFNLKAFCSYLKDQGTNAPVGKQTVFAYTTALNDLLAKGSKHRLQVGDASTVFWSEQPHQMENLLADLFGISDKDDPSQRIESIRALFAAPQSGAPPLDGDSTRFYVLGLAPNAARISIRFWHAGTVGEIATNIKQYFKDIEVVSDRKDDTNFPSLYRLLLSTAVQGKADNIIPSVAGKFMESILDGTPFPVSLLSATLRRIRADHELNFTRASLIKGCLVRQSRYYQSEEKEITVALDESNSNKGYCLGRMFAVLEKAQEEANPGINATIRDRFFGSASATPVTVFPHLLKLANHHTSKLDNRGRAVNLEKLIGKIADHISDLPTHLSLPDQGRFCLGYYHQRQALFTKASSTQEQGEQ